MRRLPLLLALLLLLAPSAHATMQTIFAGTSSNMGTTQTNYSPVMGGDPGGWGGNENERRQVAPAVGVINDLRIQLSAAPGTFPNSRTFVLMLNGSATTLGCVVVGTVNVNCSDTVSPIVVAEKDLISIRQVPTSSPTNASATWSVTYITQVTPFTVLMGGTGRNSLNSTLTDFVTLHALYAEDVTEFETQTLIPLDGQIGPGFFVQLEADLPTGDSWVFTVRHEGADTSITCTITGGAGGGDTVCADATNTVTGVSAGDTISLSAAPSGSPTAQSVGTGLIYIPDNRGEFIIAFSTDDALNDTQDEYNHFDMADSRWTPTEASVDQIANDTTGNVNTIYVELDEGPCNPFLSVCAGGNDGWEFNFRGNAAGTQGCDIVGTNTSCNGSVGFALQDGSLHDTEALVADSQTDNNPKAIIAYAAENFERRIW